MDKKLLGLVGFLVLLLVVIVGSTYVITATTYSLYDVEEHAYHADVLSSDTPTLYYYYQDTCHFCNSIKDQVSAFAQKIGETEGIDFKLVDMKDSENTWAWYDWASHIEKYGEDTPATVNPDFISDPAQMKTPEDIEVTGTPAALYVKDGKVVSAEAGKAIFDTFEKVEEDFNIGYKFNRDAYGAS